MYKVIGQYWYAGAYRKKELYSGKTLDAAERQKEKYQIACRAFSVKWEMWIEEN